jgi:hypothetical protein
MDAKNALPNVYEFNKLMNRKEYDKIVEQLKCKISYQTVARNENWPQVDEKVKKFEMDKDYYKAYHEMENGEWKRLGAKVKTEANLRAFYNGLRRGSNNLEMIQNPKIKFIESFFTKENKKRIVVYSNYIVYGLMIFLFYEFPWIYIKNTCHRYQTIGKETQR